MCDLLLVVFALDPFHNVKVPWAVERDRIAVEEVGHEHKVAVGGELVGDELGVDEAVADHVGDTSVSVSIAIQGIGAMMLDPGGLHTSRFHIRSTCPPGI